MPAAEGRLKRLVEYHQRGFARLDSVWKHVQEVTAAVFQYIQLVKDQGVQQWCGPGSEALSTIESYRCLNLLPENVKGRGV